MKKITPQILKELFEPISHVDDEDLQFLIEKSNHFVLKEDDYLFKSGEPSDHMYMMLEGRVKVILTQGNKTRQFFELQKGDITGLLPYSRLTTSKATGQADRESEVLAFPRKHMTELIHHHYSLTEALVHFMSTRIREFTTLQQQNEKMMALGKLSAGLAHELNNPASAIVRSSKELLSHLKHQPQQFRKVMSIRVTPEEVDEVAKILNERINGEAPKLSMMQKQNLEDDLADCLENLNADNAFEIAENLVEFNFSCDEIDRIHEITGDDHFPPVIGWINQNLTTEKMVRDIESASSRIAELVGSVKNFTHMDRSPDKIEADIHEGINNTLVMLNHKLKKTGIKVTRIYDENIPKPKILVSELNQVWTNIIDNAIDAMENTDGAELQIETQKDKEFIRTLIRDNGPGIPEDVIQKIWDPFYTTKDIGKGTGLGLDVVKNIIARHNGSIKVKSESGKTEFEVCLPIN